ncbi:MAG: hypothetical protein V4654_11665 [Bdellovibrionota bacterium]
MKTLLGLGKVFFAVVILVLLSACSDDNLPEFNKLEGLRVLAFSTSTPEVNPGTTVTLTPVISDLTATNLSFSVFSCIDLGVSYGADPSCEGNPSKIVIATNQPLTLPGSSENWTGLADSFTVSVPSDTVLFAGRSAQEKYNGLSYLIEYILTNDRGQSTKSLKRILVSESSKTTKNQNPVVTDVLADGVSMSSLSFGSEQSLSTNLSMGSFEPYSVKLSDGSLESRTEQITTTWFITDGETKYYRSVGTSSNPFTNPSGAPSGRSFYLLAVTRDDRGGVSVVKKKF